MRLPTQKPEDPSEGEGLLDVLTPYRGDDPLNENPGSCELYLKMKGVSSNLEKVY